MQKKIQKMFFVSDITASENVPINCLCEAENTCDRQSVVQLTALRF